jgi:hypothetical protein
MSTATVDFTATDKMTVLAGLRKLSDAALGMIVELSDNYNTNAGTFLIYYPNGNNTILSSALSHGDGLYNRAHYTDSAAPVTGVFSTAYDKSLSSNEVLFVRKNGVVKTIFRFANNNTSGNFGNYPIYIGSRGGTTFPLNGHLYSLIVRGAQSTDAQIVAAETWLNSNTAAY